MTPHIVSIRLKRCNTILRWCVADGQRDTLLKWPQVDSALDSVRKHHTVADILNLLKPFIEPDIHIEFLVLCRSFQSSKMVATSNELPVCLPVVIYMFIC